ncbi:MAG: ABC transporter ATP-binding protein, partial [Oscillospiraceae bacterium]
MARNKYDIDEELETPFNIKHLSRCKVYIKKHAKQMIFALLINIVAIILTLFTPKLTQIALDVAIPNKDIQQLIMISSLVFIIIVSSVFLIKWRSKIMIKVGQNIIYDIRNDIFEKLQQLPFSYFDNRPHGKIIVRVVQYVNQVSDMLSNGIINFILDIINLIFIAIFMFTTDFKLALVILAGLPILAIIVFAIKPMQRKSWQKYSDKNSNYNAYVHESITGSKINQLYTRDDLNQEIFQNLSVQTKKTFMGAVYVSNIVWVSVDNIATIVAAMIYIMGVLIVNPAASYGVIFAMGNYAWRFWQPITSLSTIYNNFINTIAYLERVFETIDEPVCIKDKENAYAIGTIKGDVTFNNVTFAYEENQDVLSGINFSVKAGESIALVGPTGAGKTTIVNLISRFYDINQGEILIDGINISDVTLYSLRSQMGIMLQDSFIFSGTLRENILYGKMDATQKEFEDACKSVHIDGFVNTLEKGYDTILKERGSGLSGGQKQLISFARTLLSNPRILVLDEATSSIDTKTEQFVQQGIKHLLSNRTSFIIAHRLSTIKNCDRIMYV